MKISRPLLLFGVAGIVGLVVDIGVLTLFRDLLGVYGARLVSFWTAATSTWLLNRYLTFSDRSAAMGLWSEYVHYMGLMLGGGTVNYATYSLLAWRFSQNPLWLMLYVAAGSLVGMTVNYLSTNLWLYRQRKD